MEYASNAKGNTGVALGAVGTGLSLLTGGAGLFGMGRGAGYGCPNQNLVTKDEAFMIKEIAYKDSEIALLKAESDSEEKMVEVYKQAHAEVMNLRDRVDDNYKELQKEINDNRRDQDAWNCSQSVANAHMSAAIAANNNSIDCLKHIVNGITAIKVPNTAVCPGWGNISIVPDPITSNGATANTSTVAG